MKPQIQIDGRRANDEWIATHPDQDIPKRVRLRIFDRCGGRCGLTGVKLQIGQFDYDHIKRLRDGGEHRETNIHVVWRPAHREKTAEENREGARADRIRAKHFGIKPTNKRKITAHVDPWGKSRGNTGRSA